MSRHDAASTSASRRGFISQALGLAAAGASLVRPAQAQDLPTVQRAFIETPAGQIHIRRAGALSPSTIPIVCYHQSPQSSLAFADVLPYLAKNRLAVAVDTPGFGESFRPSHQPIIADYSKWLAEVSKRLGLAHVDVVGMFTGSAIAVETARQFPGLIRRMVLIGPALFDEEQRKQMLAAAWPTSPPRMGRF